MTLKEYLVAEAFEDMFFWAGIWSNVLQMMNQSNVSVIPVSTNAHVEHDQPMMRRPLESVTCYKVCVYNTLPCQNSTDLSVQV